MVSSLVHVCSPVNQLTHDLPVHPPAHPLTRTNKHKQSLHTTHRPVCVVQLTAVGACVAIIADALWVLTVAMSTTEVVAGFANVDVFQGPLCGLWVTILCVLMLLSPSESSATEQDHLYV